MLNQINVPVIVSMERRLETVCLSVATSGLAIVLVWTETLTNRLEAYIATSTQRSAPGLLLGHIPVLILIGISTNVLTVLLENISQTLGGRAVST